MRCSFKRSCLTVLVVAVISSTPLSGQTAVRVSQRLKPELVLEVGHTYRIESLAFDPQSRLLATAGGSKDKTIKLWEVATGRELRTLAGHGARVNSLAFSPNGKQLASGSDDDSIRVWDVDTGRQIQIFYVPREGVTRLAFSPSGHRLISSPHSRPWDPRLGRAIEPDPELAHCPAVENKPGFCTAKDVTVWDLRTGLPAYNLPPSWDFAFSPDGRLLVTSGNNTKVQMWEVSSGHELPALPGAAAPFIFSADGQRIVSASNDNTVKLWDVNTAKEIRSFAGTSVPVRLSSKHPWLVTTTSDGYKDIVKLWDINTGKEIQALGIETAGPGHKAFSQDARWITATDYYGGLTLWDLDSGKISRTSDGWRGPVDFSPDGRWLASVGRGGTPWLLDLGSGNTICTQAGGVTAISSVALRADGPTSKSLATGGSGITLWDLVTGERSKSIGREDYQVANLRFGAGGSRLISAGPSQWRTFEAIQYISPVGSPGEERPATVVKEKIEDPSDCLASSRESLKGDGYIPEDQIVVWEVATGNLLRYLPGGTAPIALSSDGQLLATGDSSDYSIKLWNLNGSVTPVSLDARNGATESLAFSLDQKFLVAKREGKEIELWQLGTNDKPAATVADSVDSHTIAVSPDGKLLAAADWGGVVKIFTMPEGKLVKQLEKRDGGLQCLAFSARQRWLAAGDGKGQAWRWDTTSWQVRPLIGHSSAISQIVFSADETKIFTGSEDGTVAIWDSETGAQLARLVSLRGGKEWLVITPDGLFDGSPAAWNQILWRFNNNTFDYAPLEVFFSDFYYPGLLADIMAGKHPVAPSDIAKKERRQPLLKLTLGDAQRAPASTERQVSVNIEVSHAMAGAQDVRLFRNGTLVKRWDGEVLKGQKTATLVATIPIIAGDNRLTAYAFNRDNIKSSDAVLLVKGNDKVKRQGTAYILAVGVDRYSNPGYDLKYAVVDAAEFSAEVKRRQETLKHYGNIEVVPLFDDQATKANIMQQLNQLATRVQPEDTVIVYFAGHGMAIENRFYLIPHDLGYTGPRGRINEAALQNLLAHSISDKELEKAFEHIDAGQILLVIDACNSGQALEAEEKRRGPMNSKGLAQLAYEKGMYVMTAAQSYQAAVEAEQYGHGYLTYALIIEGLKNGAADDEPKDGTVWVREWLDYATNRVPQMQLEKMLQAVAEGKSEFSFVEGERGDIPPGQRTVQRPRVFYRRELEANPLVIARPQSAPR